MIFLGSSNDLFLVISRFMMILLRKHSRKYVALLRSDLSRVRMIVLCVPPMFLASLGTQDDSGSQPKRRKTKNSEESENEDSEDQPL